jgi:hypothetical protein
MSNWFSFLAQIVTGLLGIGLFCALLWYALILEPGALGAAPGQGPITNWAQATVAISRNITVLLTPIGIIYAALRPDLWKGAFIPPTWAIVATIIVDPDAFIRFGDWTAALFTDHPT